MTSLTEHEINAKIQALQTDELPEEYEHPYIAAACADKAIVASNMLSHQMHMLRTPETFRQLSVFNDRLQALRRYWSDEIAKLAKDDTAQELQRAQSIEYMAKSTMALGNVYIAKALYDLQTVKEAKMAIAEKRKREEEGASEKAEAMKETPMETDERKEGM